ncbi:hypothetical protein D3C81_930020 [compost metagenome]
MLFTPDGPELQMQLGEIAGDMEAEATAAAQALPRGVVAVEFEVAEAGMEGQVAWRHRQGDQGDARQLQADQPAQGLAGADLDLPGQLLAQSLQGQVGAYGEDELGVVQQALVAQCRAHHAVLQGFDRQRHRPRLQHRAQGPAQGQFQGLEALVQVVVLVGRAFLGQVALIGEGHQLAAGLGKGDVQAFGVNMALTGQVLEQREPAIEGLQQVEVGDIGHPGLPW